MKTSFGFEAIKRMLLLYQPEFIEAKAKGEEKLRPIVPGQQEPISVKKRFLHLLTSKQTMGNPRQHQLHQVLQRKQILIFLGY